MISEFTTSDGLVLKYSDRQCDRPLGSLVFVHGVGEHMQRYEATFEYFAAHGFSCSSYDQRGFGSSPGQRGHVEQFADYVDDLAQFVGHTSTEGRGEPLFVLGHSMGAIVSLLYAIRRPPELTGLVALSTPLELPAGISSWALPLVARLSEPFPALSVPNFLDARKLSHDTEVVQAYKEDKKIVHSVTTSWLREFNGARKQILTEAESIEVPAFVGHGTQDRIANPDGSRLLIERLQKDRTTLKFYDGLKHELLNESEPGRSQVRQDILDWLSETASNS